MRELRRLWHIVGEEMEIALVLGVNIIVVFWTRGLAEDIAFICFKKSLISHSQQLAILLKKLGRLLLESSYVYRVSVDKLDRVHGWCLITRHDYLCLSWRLVLINSSRHGCMWIMPRSQIAWYTVIGILLNYG